MSRRNGYLDYDEKRQSHRRRNDRVRLWMFGAVICLVLLALTLLVMAIIKHQQGNTPTIENRGTPTPVPTATLSPTPSPSVSATPTATPTPTERPTLIVIDPGHGGTKDWGCTHGGVMEKEISLSISIFVRDKLLAAGYDVVMTRETDIAVMPAEGEKTTSSGLYERARIANDAEADLYVSIHLNAMENNTTTSGIETWYNANKDIESAVFARTMLDAIMALFPDTISRGVNVNNGLVVIRETKMPSCLVELGFLSNPTEREYLQNEYYQALLADGIVNGIQDYLDSVDAQK